MRVLLDDAFATTPFTLPIVSGWVIPPSELSIEIVPGLRADAIGEEDIALASTSCVLTLKRSHAVFTDVAVVADGVGAIAMRTPVRPDEIERTPVWLREVSGAAELLARATLMPFYGIQATDWIRSRDAPGAASAEVVIVEGAEALREPEAGFSEDLVRAWYIMTAKPVVSHLAFVPQGLSLENVQAISTMFDAIRRAGVERRGEWISRLGDSEDVPRERSSAFWAAQRFSLTNLDQSALRTLLRDGTLGTSGAELASVQFISGTTSV